jgi:hypothetical protein
MSLHPFTALALDFTPGEIQRQRRNTQIKLYMTCFLEKQHRIYATTGLSAHYVDADIGNIRLF